jgi:hypothetical protein
MTVRHRTFVKLDGHEKKIVDNLRRLLRKPNGRLPRRSAVIKGVIRDYWRRLEQDRIVDHNFDAT